MIISRTPYRVSLFGGGTDLPAWSNDHGGEVIGFAINRYCWISLRQLPPFFEHKHRIVWSEVETVKHWHDVKHPVVRAVMDIGGLNCGVELHHDGDLPARSGIGSSSSFTVGLLNALHAFKGHHAEKDRLAREAIHIEREVLGENVGSQDQIWAAYGGLNHIEFRRDGGFDVSPVIVSDERRIELETSLMLFFTGFSRFSSEVAGRVTANMAARERHLHAMKAMVGEARAILHGKSLVALGALLHESWKLKRDLAEGVSTAEIDLIYEAGRAAGATGGKLLGAGGGGFMLFFVPQQAQKAVRDRLSSLVEVPFGIDYAGSRISLYEPQGM